MPLANPSSPVALAIAAHPDDIEFLMAGTLCLLRNAGWQIHCFNLAAGNLGSMTASGIEIAATRADEAKAAAKIMGAVWHPPIACDLEVFYTDVLLRKVCSVIRQVRPAILLTHGPHDYMEDHETTCRLAVTAAFSRGMPNYRSHPTKPPFNSPIRIYHAPPHGLLDGMNREVQPEFLVNTSSVHQMKRQALACHASQQKWLDETQGMGSCLDSMDAFSQQLARSVPGFVHAEGWRRHSHLGFCPPGFDPLIDILSPFVERASPDPTPRNPLLPRS